MNAGDLVRCRRRVFVKPDDRAAQDIWEMGIVIDNFDVKLEMVTVFIAGTVLYYHVREVKLAKRASVE